jgi:hypothetical protein
MMTKSALGPSLSLLLWMTPAVLSAQAPVPTTQPAVLTIYREEVKFGHAAAHENVEAGWPAVYAKVKSPYAYIGVTSITGPSEAWFISPYADWKTYSESYKADNTNPQLAPELARLSAADAEHVTTGRSIHLVGRPDLSAGTFPSIAKARFYEITTFRVRPGHERAFEEAAKVYAAAFKKAVPSGSYRIYQVVAGLPAPTFMVFSSSESLAAYDSGPSMDAALGKTFTTEDMATLQKFSRESVINTETQRFAVNGRMSYVDDATAAVDPAFWRPGVKASK